MDNAAPTAGSNGMEHGGGTYFENQSRIDEFELREEEPRGRGVTLHLQPKRVRCLSQIIDAESVCQSMLEVNDGRKGVGDDRLVIDVDGNGKEVVTSPFEEHRGLAEEVREARLLGEEKNEGVVHSRGACLRP